MKALRANLQQREKLREMIQALFPELMFITYVEETIMTNPDKEIISWYEVICRYLAPKLIYHDPPWRNDYERLRNFLASHVHDDKQHPIDKLYEIYESTRSNTSKRKLSSNQVS